MIFRCDFFKNSSSTALTLSRILLELDLGSLIQPINSQKKHKINFKNTER